MDVFMVEVGVRDALGNVFSAANVRGGGEETRAVSASPIPLGGDQRARFAELRTRQVGPVSLRFSSPPLAPAVLPLSVLPGLPHICWK